MPAGSEVLTTEYKVNFIAAADGRAADRPRPRDQAGPDADHRDGRSVLRAGRRESACAIMLSSLIRVPAPR